MNRSLPVQRVPSFPWSCKSSFNALKLIKTEQQALFRATTATSLRPKPGFSIRNQNIIKSGIGSGHSVLMTTFYYNLVNYQSSMTMRTTFSKLICINTFNIMCPIIYLLSYKAGNVFYPALSELPNLLSKLSSEPCGSGADFFCQNLNFNLTEFAHQYCIIVM